MIAQAKKLAVVLVLSAVILAVIIHFVGFDATVQAIAEAGPAAFLATALLMVLLLVLQAAAWSALNRGIGHRIPFATLFKAAAVGMAGNIVTPSTYLGGEPVKVVYVGRKTGLSYGELAGTVLLGKYLEALSFVLFLGVSTAAAAIGFRRVLFRAPHLVLGGAMLLVVCVALGLSVVLWLSLSRRRHPLTGLVRLVARARVWPRFFAAAERKTRTLEDQVSRVFCEEGRAVVPAFFFYLFTHVVIFFKPAGFFMLGWRTGLGTAQLGLIFVTCQVLLAVQLTPSGVGTLDGGLFGMLALTGIPISAPQCAAFLLCIRVVDALVVSLGGSLAARAGAGFLLRSGPPAAGHARLDIST
ncbi:MAG: flippase-like domain-containing protein [Kiritimatiellae bacterium]|nr:flippase-like domain-containing protein [Kiritimatiellia bacterium]